MASQQVASLAQADWSPPHFIGRQNELAFIWGQYEAARNGYSNVTLLVGEPGIGKTRLLDELALRVAQDGALVLRGGAFEADGMPPYLPFLEAIGRYIRITPWERLQKQIAHAPHTLLSIFPELATYLGSEQLPHTLPSDQARLRLYQAIGLFLENISSSQPLVLILDDLHWMDSASLDLLCYITRHHSKAKLFIMGAYRKSEVNRTQALNRALTELVRQRMLTTVAVDPLSSQETEDLAVNYLGGPISGDVSLLLYTQSEGNPFFAEELIRGWVEAKTLVKDEAHWYAPVLLECTLPSSIIGALRQRFALLAPETINHLRVAAIIGRTFDLPLLAAVEKQEIESLEEQIVEAERASLVRSNQEGTYTFNHDNIRACLYAEVSASRRRRLHEAIGQVLEERDNTVSTKSAYELAAIVFHFTHSDNPARAMAYTQQAAEQALQALAVEETNQRRIEFVERCQQQNAYPWLALMLSSQGSWQEAEQAIARAHPMSSPESLSYLWHMHGFLAFQREDYVMAEHHFQAARSNRQNSPADFLLSTSMFGLTLAAQGKQKEAAEVLTELEALLGELGERSLPLAPIITCMALTAVALGDLQRMEKFYSDLLASRGQHYLFLVDRVLGEICAARGDWEGAMIHLNEAEAKAKQGGLRPELARILLAKAHCEVAQDKAESRGYVVSILLSVMRIFEALHMVEATSRVLAWLNSLTSDNRYEVYAQPVNIPYTQRKATSARAKGLPANLTRSEANVLQIVVQGKSNRQIAQELSISEKTVANHLSHIFSKTESENRAAATAFAIRNGLA